MQLTPSVRYDATVDGVRTMSSDPSSREAGARSRAADVVRLAGER